MLTNETVKKNKDTEWRRKTTKLFPVKFAISMVSEDTTAGPVRKSVGLKQKITTPSNDSGNRIPLQNTSLFQPTRFHLWMKLNRHHLQRKPGLVFPVTLISRRRSGSPVAQRRSGTRGPPATAPGELSGPALSGEVMLAPGHPSKPLEE